ncbi:glycoside hydrolase family 65 protein [Infirmifilum sp. SLHALR2]
MKKYVFREKEVDRETIASLTTLSNGFISVRGDPEFLETQQGMFVAGVYGYTPVFYRELVNIPRAHALYLEIEGVPLAPSDVTYTLDTREGSLEIDALLDSPLGLVEYSSKRFVHRRLQGLLGLKIRLRSLTASGKLCVKAPIELEFSNPSVPDGVRVKLYRVLRAESRGTSSVEVESNDGKYRLSIASTVSAPPGLELRDYTTRSQAGQVFCTDIGPGDTLDIERFASVAFTREETEKLLDVAKSTGFDALLTQHREEWGREWESMSLKVEGDEELSDALFFNTFHLLQVYNPNSEVFMLPARGLHGYGYRGHVFWDTEIYAFPFYLFFKPDAARKILEFRCCTLQAVLENARRNGYRGAQYPWESADDGFEATPRFVPLDPAGREGVRIFTGDLEHHITADVAYAVDLYYRYTGDKDFFSRCGLRMLVETARFWASRAEWDEDRRAYVIRNVIGPDEYHVGVDNNFYTNVMAKHNLELAVRYCREAQLDPELGKVLSELEVGESEVGMWYEIASKLLIPCSRDGLCEQFDGYFRLKDYKLPAGNVGEKGLPREILQEIQSTQLVKQADVVAGLFLLREKFPVSVHRANYEYYLPRTTHASSLSLPMYAAEAFYLGEFDEGYEMLKKAALADLRNVYGNAQDGFHVGSAGGVWMAILFGLLRIDDLGSWMQGSSRAFGRVRLFFSISIRGKRYSVSIA